MENLKFVKSFIRFADIRTSESGAFLRIHHTAEFTDEVLAQMGWTDPGESSKKTRMTGELPAGNYIFTPDSEQLRNNEIQFSFSGAQDFDVVTITKDESQRREVRFIVHSEAEESAGKVYDYVKKLKKATGTLQLNYVTQGELGL